MVLFRNLVLNFLVGGVLFFFSPQTSAYMGNVCLHPLERMALFHGTGGKRSKKSSYKSQIKRLSASIRRMERKIDKQKNKLKGATDALGNSLDGAKLGEDAEDVADSITDYIQDEQNGWNCQEEEGAKGKPTFASLELSFLPGVFGSLLPLLWETSQVYAVAGGRGNTRTETVTFTLDEKRSNCLTSGGQLSRFGERHTFMRCDCSHLEESARPDARWNCKCHWQGKSLPCDQVAAIKAERKGREEEQIRRTREGATDRSIKNLGELRRKKKCQEDYSSLGFERVNGKGQCLCPWEGRVLLPCEEVKKIKAGVKIL